MKLRMLLIMALLMSLFSVLNAAPGGHDKGENWVPPASETGTEAQVSGVNNKEVPAP